MSDSVKKHSCTLVAGVFKFDFKVAGWPELMKVARDWAQDPHFHEIIVRHVSETNLGLQFVYLSQENNEHKFDELKKDLTERVGKVYAWDVNTITRDTPEEVLEHIVVLKGLQK
jgi:hypothetical protein